MPSLIFPPTFWQPNRNKKLDNAVNIHINSKHRKVCKNEILIPEIYQAGYFRDIVYICVNTCMWNSKQHPLSGFSYSGSLKTALYNDSFHPLAYSPMMFKLEREGGWVGAGSSVKQRQKKKKSFLNIVENYFLWTVLRVDILCWSSLIITSAIYNQNTQQASSDQLICWLWPQLSSASRSECVSMRACLCVVAIWDLGDSALGPD